jgi:phage tail sheath protein FI
VFEPNSQPTWQRVRAAIDSYLHNLWQQGALAGNTPTDAWFVQVGKGLTMTEDEINQGKMIIKIGLAAVRPAEFIILQFSQDIVQ